MTTPKPMLAKSAEDLPLGDGWRYEPKWDGFRAIVTRDADGVRIDSRGDRPLGRYFPELVKLLASQPPATYVMDGEIVMIANGVMDFETLQLRLHPAASRVNKLAGEIPSTLVAFDLLELDGRDVRPLTTDERRAALEGLIERLGAELAPDSPGGLHPGPALILTPQTADEATAERWFADVDGVGQDGIVAKRAEQRYVEGERVMVKVKHHRTADCVVGGYRVERNGDGVGSLLLGLYDDEGTLQYVGHTSAFKAKERRELRETLEPLVGGDELRRGPEPGRTEPMERGPRHRVGHARTEARVRGPLRAPAGRPVPPLGVDRPMASRPRPEELHVRPARAGPGLRTERQSTTACMNIQRCPSGIGRVVQPAVRLVLRFTEDHGALRTGALAMGVDIVDVDQDPVDDVRHRRPALARPRSLARGAPVPGSRGPAIRASPERRRGRARRA